MTRKKQIIYPLAILLAGVGGFVAFSSMQKPPEEKPKEDNTPLVAIESVELQPVNLSVTSYGVVKPKFETQLVAQVTGQIVELSDAFQKGGFVTKGQILAKIDPSDFEAALIEAQASLASAEAALEQEKAQGKVREDEWKRIHDAAPTRLSLRKPQLAQEVARVKAAKAAVKRAKRNLERTQISAPYDALIEERQIGLGSFVTTGSQLGKVLSVSSAEVRLPVADNQLKFLAEQGKNAQVTLSGEYAGTDINWQATIIRSEGVVDSKSRMSYLVAEVNDPYSLSTQKPLLRFGSYVNAEIVGISYDSAAVIPRHLINQDQVAVLNSESELEYKQVNVIKEEGKEAIVGGGLSSGDKLITSALDYPIPGMKLALVGSRSSDESKTDDTEATQVAKVED